MSDILATSADGQFRVVLDVDEYAENPRTWADVMSGALTVPDRNYLDVPESGPLAAEWRRLTSPYAQHTYADAVEIMARYIRVFHGGVSDIITPHNGPTALFYILPEMMRGAGFSDEASTSVARMTEALQAELREYRSYVEGEVYIVRVEELQVWGRMEQTDDGLQLADDLDTREEWETIDSLAQVIGDDHARAEGMRMLADAVGVAVRPAAFTSGNAVATGITCPGCGQEITVTDTSKTECGGEGEGDCDVAGDGDVPQEQRIAAEHAHQRAVEIAAPFLD